MTHLRQKSGGRFFVFVAFLALAGFLGLLTLGAQRSYEREQQFARRNAENLSRVLAGHVQATVEKTDVVLQDVAASYPSWLAEHKDPAQINTLLRQSLKRIDEAQSLRIVGPDGKFIADASGLLATANVPDRAYFSLHSSRADAGLVISGPLFSRITGNWVITLSRRLEAPDGQFSGIVLASIPASYFAAFLRVADVGREGELAVLNADGSLFVHVPDAPARIGKSFAPSRLLDDLGRGKVTGFSEEPSPFDGVERILSYRRVSGTPLVVVVGLGTHEVLDDWRQKIAFNLFSALLLTVVMSVLIVVWHRSHESALNNARHLFDYDALTDLPKLQVLHDRLANLPAYYNVALLLLDLDHFKLINETLGHAIGDRVLQIVARRLRQAIDARDLLSRQGGDEFVIFLSDCGTAAGVAHAAGRVLDRIAQPVEIDGHELALSASIGIALYPDDGNDLSELLKSADVAMYQAKAAGRSGFQFFKPEMNAEVSDRIQLESTLRKAVQRNELVLHFQPQCAAGSRRLLGFEALVRWQHPLFGLIPPTRFIPLAEESKLILPIGEWVLREACRQNRAWQDAGLPPVVVAVNLSAVQFRHPDLCTMVRDILSETGLEARYLEFEITESVVMHDSDKVIGVLAELKRIGVKLSIDDFGTGYSSLSYLKRFPIDKIKIDRSFVQEVIESRDDQAIVDAILSIARSLGLRVIAEGVETQAQYDFLAVRTCDEIQGFLFGRPLPADEAAQLLATDEALPPRA
jgi:diguanylate cyclase (GGDEF)-like protein